MDSLVPSFTTMLLALVLVLAIAWLVLRVIHARVQPRAGRAKGPDDTLRFVRALAIGSKERVVIIEHAGARWMLGVTAGGISTIAHWSTKSTGQSMQRTAARDETQQA
jgi:flagellar protein FliO/FliZ